MTGPVRTVHCAARALLVVCTLAVPQAGASESVPTELATGVARFALDTGNIAQAIPLAGQVKGDSADYLNARVLLASGRTSEAKRLLERVFNSNVHRAEAALELARLAEAGGDQVEADRWYQEVVRTGFGEVRQRALLNLAETQRQQGKADRAGQYLASMDDGYWAAVGYMNLAGDFARDDLDPSRALVSLRVAMAMAAKDPDSARSADLRNQLYLRAGYLSVRNQDYDKATDFLEKVSLESYYTPRPFTCMVSPCPKRAITERRCRAGTAPRNSRWRFPGWPMPGSEWAVDTIWRAIRGRPAKPGLLPTLLTKGSG